MPELDPFDARLGAGIRAFADRAQTSVDAAAMAEHARRHRRTGRLSWLGVAVPVPVSILIVLGLLLLALALAFGAGAPWSHQGSVLPIALASPTAPQPLAGHDPHRQLADARADADRRPGRPRARHRDRLLSGAVPGHDHARQKGIAHTQGVVIEVTTDMDDPRVTGTGTYHLDSTRPERWGSPRERSGSSRPTEPGKAPAPGRPGTTSAPAISPAGSRARGRTPA